MSTHPETTIELVRRCASKSQSRIEYWAQFINDAGVKNIAEVGVYEGDFAAVMLQNCPGISKYYMIDPWKHLSDWNKPANQDNASFERIFETAKLKTDFAAAKRIILRGKTTDGIDSISDAELDFAYIDGDHTLRGVSIDLIKLYPKIRKGGFIGGDDFSRTIWAHKTTFEPTLVFPFAVYFAEAVGATIYALPNIQFCLQKPVKPEFRFIDLAGRYNDLTLKTHLEEKTLLKLFLGERFPRALTVFRSVRRIFG